MKLKKLRDLFFFVALLTIFSNKLYANPQEFIYQLTSDASKILASSQSKEDKMIALIDLAEQNVDIEGIGMYTLGKHRKSLNEKQTEEYKLLFRKYFLKSFASRLSEYTDPKITVLSEEVINNKYTIVFSKLEADEKRPEIKIDWRVYTIDPEKPLIRDLIIEGLSLARTQREEFNSVIQNGDGKIDVLFSNLRNFIEK